MKSENPFAWNAPLFIAFRVLFNARFYYPVIGVLFLDLGLSLEQYALLNAIWAVVIVALEIPSGALADWIGRKRMVVLAAALMVAEMMVFALAPVGSPALLFWLLVLNRILSGAAEACASGADEALAYDSIPHESRASEWPRLLERLMRWKSAAFFGAMIFGAALFDPAWLPFSLEPGTTTRWPVYATCLTAFACLAVALAFREPPRTENDAPNQKIRGTPLLNLRNGARHVFTTRKILLLLLAALLCDSFIRIFLTFASNFYRLIELPEFVNGFLGSAVALIGFVAAPLARRMVLGKSPAWNFLMLAGLVWAGLIGLFFPMPLLGAWVVLPFGLAMSLLQFFAAHYLNEWTDSEVRATVLSFRGVALNLGYALAGVAFAAITERYRTVLPGAGENEILAEALRWLAPAFLGFVTAGLLFRKFARSRPGGGL